MLLYSLKEQFQCINYIIRSFDMNESGHNAMGTTNGLVKVIDFCNVGALERGLYLRFSFFTILRQRLIFGFIQNFTNLKKYILECE